MGVDAAVQAFARAWNIDDDEVRLRLLRECCAPDAEFVAPQGITNGVEAFNAAIGDFRRSFPPAEVTHGPPDAHFGFARMFWATEWHDGRPRL